MSFFFFPFSILISKLYHHLILICSSLKAVYHINGSVYCWEYFPCTMICNPLISTSCTLLVHIQFNLWINRSAICLYKNQCIFMNFFYSNRFSEAWQRRLCGPGVTGAQHTHLHQRAEHLSYIQKKIAHYVFTSFTKCTGEALPAESAISFWISKLHLFIFFSILFLHQGDCSQIILSNWFPLFGLKN